MSTSERPAWVILTSRYGGDIREPTVDELCRALADVYHENDPSMTEGAYAEHPNALLRYGFDAGPMYVLNVYRSGTVYFSQWADPDYESELEPELERINVSEREAHRLWELLSAGKMDEIKASGWDAT
jgi:hypothetical protein